MKKLKPWQIVLLVIFYPVGICVLIYRLVKGAQLKRAEEESRRAAEEEKARKAAAERDRVYAERARRASLDRRVYRVVGVTFDNDDGPGRNRQEILREIEADCPRPSAISLEVYDYEGEPAVGVFYRGEQVGNIAKTDLPAVLPLMDRYAGLSDFAVTGGGGEGSKYGLEIAVYFKKAG